MNRGVGSLLALLLPLAMGCLAPSLVSAQAGGSLFRELCAICHGAAGKGDGPSAAGLHPRPADLSDCTVMTGKSNETLFATIKSGGQGVGRSTVMPSWGDALTDQQIHGLVAFIRSLCKR